MNIACPPPDPFVSSLRTSKRPRTTRATRTTKPNFKKEFLDALEVARVQWEKDKLRAPTLYADKYPSWFAIAGYLNRQFPDVHDAICKACDRADLAGAA